MNTIINFLNKPIVIAIMFIMVSGMFRVKAEIFKKKKDERQVKIHIIAADICMVGAIIVLLYGLLR